MGRTVVSISAVRPTIEPMDHLTGAARRSVAAADAAAIAKYDELDRRLSVYHQCRVALMEHIDATNIASFLGALADVESADMKVVPRWRPLYQGSQYEIEYSDGRRAYGSLPGVGSTPEVYREKLKKAGVPIPPYDSDDPVQWWRDIAALGA